MSRPISIGKASRPAEHNTIILPDVDVSADLEAIQSGHARWDSTSNRYEVDGRWWGIEPNGTAFPEAGAGMVTLNRSEYQALKGVIQSGGDREQLPASLTRNPSISWPDWDKAFEVYNHHKGSGQ